MKRFLFIFCSSLLLLDAAAQVAINTSGNPPAPSSLLDLSSTTNGVLLPRMTSTQRKAITSPAMGLLVYDTDRQTVYLFDGVEWRPMMVALDHTLPLISRHPDKLGYASNFGVSVDIFGNYAVVGAPNDTANNLNCGAAYIYFKENGTWKQQAKLFASNAAAGDKFGSSVSLYNDVVVIGAPYKTISGLVGKGRVYVFKRIGHGWTQVAGLQASNGQAYDGFGSSVAIENQVIVAGAPNTAHGGKTYAGSAYVFRFENNAWMEKKILTPPDPVNHGYFGFSVDLSAATIAVGAPNATVAGITNVGAVYTFNSIDFSGTNWVMAQKLEPDDKQPEMQFGFAIDLEGDSLLAGAPGYDMSANAPGAGRCLHFARANGVWSNWATLNSLEGSESAGYAVAILGEYSFVSSPDWEEHKGRIKYYTIGGTGFKYLYNNDRDAIRFFGKAIAAHNGQYIVGAPGYGNGGAVFFGILD